MIYLRKPSKQLKLDCRGILEAEKDRLPDDVIIRTPAQDTVVPLNPPCPLDHDAKLAAWIAWFAVFRSRSSPNSRKIAEP
jgi:hypothetical protein